MSKTVTITITGGTNTGPNFNFMSNGVDTNVIPYYATKTQLIDGVTVTVHDSATVITVSSEGTCTNSIVLPIISLSPTPTPTPTQTQTGTPAPGSSSTPTPTQTQTQTPTPTTYYRYFKVENCADPSIVKYTVTYNNNEFTYGNRVYWGDPNITYVITMTYDPAIDTPPVPSYDLIQITRSLDPDNGQPLNGCPDVPPVVHRTAQIFAWSTASGPTLNQIQIDVAGKMPYQLPVGYVSLGGAFISDPAITTVTPSTLYTLYDADIGGNVINGGNKWYAILYTAGGNVFNYVAYITTGGQIQDWTLCNGSPTPTPTPTPTPAVSATLSWTYSITGGPTSQYMDIYVNGSPVESRSSDSSGNYTVYVGDIINVNMGASGCSGFNDSANVYTSGIIVDASCSGGTTSFSSTSYTVVSGDIGNVLHLDTFASCDTACV
jgi:hypothetical protein